MLLSDFAERRKFRNAGIGEDDVKFSLCFDGLIKTIEVGQFGNVSLNASDVAADLLYRRVEFFLTAAHDEDVGTLFYEELCCSQPYPGCATGNDCYFSLQLLIFGHRKSPLAASSGWLGFVSNVTNTCGHAVARLTRPVRHRASRKRSLRGARLCCASHGTSPAGRQCRPRRDAPSRRRRVPAIA